MSFVRYALPALAAAQSAYAASCSVSATTTIQNSGDATGLASCKTFTGSIAIATGTTDSIALDGIQKLDGNLVVANVSQLTSLSSSDMEEITGEFNLDDVQILSTLSFPSLTTVNAIVWNALANLQQLTFTTGVDQAATVDIQNTQLNTLDGINLQVVDTFTIANNPFLNKIEAQLGNVTTAMTLQSNGANLEVAFPNLIWAYNMSLHNCSSISLPSLASLNGSLGFYSNSFENFTAPNLTTIGGSLSFVSNTALSNISFPDLTTIKGGFQIANNTEVEKVDGFAKLATVGGALDFYGNFTEVDLPALKDVAGAFNMQSSGDITDTCSHFSSIHGSNNVIKGKFTCAGSVAKPGGEGSTPTSTSSGSKSTKSGAAGHLDVSMGSVMGISGVLAAMFGML